MALKIVLITACLVFAMAFIRIRTLKGGVAGVISKAVASLAFVSAGVIAISLHGANLGTGLIVIGLVCGLVGDILLDLKVVYPQSDCAWTNSGMAAFGLGHISFAFGFALIAGAGSNLTLCALISAGVAIVLASAIMLLGKPLKLKFGKYFAQSYIYAILLVFMASFSIALSFNFRLMYIAAVGFVLFFASDLVLSTQYFGGKLDNKPLIVVNHALYYLAQISIVAFLLFM